MSFIGSVSLQKAMQHPVAVIGILLHKWKRKVCAIWPTRRGQDWNETRALTAAPVPGRPRVCSEYTLWNHNAEWGMLLEDSILCVRRRVLGGAWGSWSTSEASGSVTPFLSVRPTDRGNFPSWIHQVFPCVPWTGWEGVRNSQPGLPTLHRAARNKCGHWSVISLSVMYILFSVKLWNKLPLG